MRSGAIDGSRDGVGYIRVPAAAEQAAAKPAAYQTTLILAGEKLSEELLVAVGADNLGCGACSGGVIKLSCRRHAD